MKHLNRQANWQKALQDHQKWQMAVYGSVRGYDHRRPKLIERLKHWFWRFIGIE